MSVLITGGTGFIGAEIVRLLLREGAECISVFDVSTSATRLDEAASRVEIIRGDVSNMSHVLGAVKRTRPDVIYHLGGMLSIPSDEDPASAIRVNAMGTFHVLEAARLFDVRQVLFSSTGMTYGADIRDQVVTDYTLQRPQMMYGITKAFCEHLGLFYKRKYGLDYRGVRYPSIVGPGVKTPGIVQYTSWVIEECAKGNPYTIPFRPDTRVPVLYFKDAALAAVKLANAPLESIRMGNYLVTGVPPASSAGELAGIVRAKVPGARIDCVSDPQSQDIIDRLARPFDDGVARKEWGWAPEYDQAAIVDDFLAEMREHPGRYA